MTQAAGRMAARRATSAAFEPRPMPFSRRSFNAMLARPHTGTNQSLRTDAGGRFSFSSLPAGTYSVTATRPAQLGVTYDSEGAYDATASVLLPPGGHGQAVVGLVGSAQLTGSILTAEGQPANGAITVRWFGPDDRVLTADDLLLHLPVTNGQVEQAGLPEGTYRIESVNGTATSVPVQLSAGHTTHVTVQQPKGSTTETSPPVASTNTEPASSLPYTGWAVAPPLVAAGICLAGGAGLAVAGRRRRRTPAEI